MSFANFGIGLGAFAQGIGNGLKLGREIRDVRDENKVRRATQEGLAGARSQRDRDVNSRIERLGLDGQQGFMGQTTTGYKVGDKTFGSEQEARSEAEKGVGTVMDYFMSSAAPKIGETYISQGRPELAQQWGEWVQNTNSQRGIQHWARALRSGQMGDMDGFASALADAYNSPGYMDDGVSVKGNTILDDGGIEMTFERDGKEFTQRFDGSEDLVQAGIGLLSPQAAFEASLKQTQAAAEARNKAAQDQNKFQRDVQMEGFKQQGRQELEATKAELRQRFGSENKPADLQKADWLIENGIASNANEAWNLANMSKTKGRQDFAMEYANLMADSVKGMRMSPEEAIQQGLQLYDNLQQAESAQPAPTPQQPSAQGGLIFYNQ